MRAAGYAPLRVASRAPDRATYLTRPDLGRRLDEESAQRLAGTAELVVAIEDGLSAIAVQNHVVPLLAALVRLSRRSAGPARRSSSRCRAASRSATRSASGSPPGSSSS